MKLILGLISLAAILSMIVPGSVFGQGDFSIFVTDDDAIHQLDLKATEGQNGQVHQVSGFAVEPNSVVQINQNENLQVFTSTNEPARIEKAKVADQSNQLIELTKVGNEWSLQGFDDGVYLLDVIVNMPNGEKGAFETVLVILASNTQNADPNQVIKQVVKTDTKVVFRDQQAKPKPIGNPYCDLVPDDYRGACHDRKDYDELTGLYPCRDGSNVKDWRDCKDAGKHPAERYKKTYPEPIVCPAGQLLSSDGLSCAPPCDGSFQDCIYNGYLCRAGSTEHACELPLEETPAIATDCVLVPTAAGCVQALAAPGNPFWAPDVVDEQGTSCQPEDDFCEPGCESPTMDCIDDVNVGDDGEDSVPDDEDSETPDEDNDDGFIDDNGNGEDDDVEEEEDSGSGSDDEADASDEEAADEEEP